MPIKDFFGSRENPSYVKFRAQLDAAISSVVPGARVDPAAVEGMLALIRAKEVSPGDALSCFKTHFREGTPEEQYNALRVLVQFVDSDPHLANHLHMELASRRWRERFVGLAASPHPEVRPLLLASLHTWAASYRAHDIGMHYNSTLREMVPGGASFRQGQAHSPQYTVYTAQQTGYSAQATGAGYPMPPPPPGYPLAVPAGYPAAVPGYPPYGPPYPQPHQQQPSGRRAPETVPQKLDQLVSEVGVLRDAIRTFETTLADYKAQRCNFGALSSAMEKGQRSADRCSALQTQMEGLLGSSDTDEALMGRVFSTNDAVVAALEQWNRLANQELSPDDSTPGAAAAGPSTSAGASTAPGPSAAPQPVRPPPSPLDLLLGDELPSPMPQPSAAAPTAAAAVPFGAAARGSSAGGGATVWNAFPASTPQPQPQAGADAAALFAAGGAAGTVAAATSAAVVPANDIEGLRAQVLALAADLGKERKMHKIQMDTQEAFHKQELAQVKAQAQARIAELEMALSAARQAPLQPLPSGGPSAGIGLGGSFLSPGGVPQAPVTAPAPIYPSLPAGGPFSPPVLAPAAAAPPQPPLTGLSSNNPFASFTPAAPPPPAPTPVPAGAVTNSFGPMGVTPPAAAFAPAPPADVVLNAFDDLAVLPKSGGGAPSRASTVPGPSPAGGAAAGSGAVVGAAGAGDSWVDFGL